MENIVEGTREIVTNPIFITDSTKVKSVPGPFVGSNARLWEIDDLQTTLQLPYQLPKTIYMVEVEEIPMLNPLTNRMSAGAGFFQSVQMATFNMYKCFSDLLEKWLVDGIKILQVIIPNGGLPMNINAFANQLVRSHHSIFPTCEMKLSRKIDVKSDQYTTCMESYRGEYDLDCKIALINDTATASGSTVEAAVNVIIHGHKDEKIHGSKNVKAIFFFTICGSKEGLQRAYQVCQKAGVAFIPVFYNAIFEVVDQNILHYIPGQTDLPLANKTSITTEAIALLAKRIYNNLPMCAVGDTGNRLINTALYFVETLLEILLIQKFKDDKYNGRTIDLEQPEWSRTKKMLACSELVEITWQFYNLRLKIQQIKKSVSEISQQRCRMGALEEDFVPYLTKAHQLINEVLQKEPTMNPILQSIASLI